MAVFGMIIGYYDTTFKNDIKKIIKSKTSNNSKSSIILSNFTSLFDVVYFMLRYMVFLCRLGSVEFVVTH